MKRFHMLPTYRLKIVAGASLSLRRDRREKPKGNFNWILLSPHEKAEKQQLSKTGRPQALDCFVLNGRASGGAHRPLLHSLHPQSHHLSNQ